MQYVYNNLGLLNQPRNMGPITPQMPNRVPKNTKRKKQTRDKGTIKGFLSFEKEKGPLPGKGVHEKQTLDCSFLKKAQSATWSRGRWIETSMKPEIPHGSSLA